MTVVPNTSLIKYLTLTGLDRYTRVLDLRRPSRLDRFGDPVESLRKTSFRATPKLYQLLVGPATKPATTRHKNEPKTGSRRTGTTEMKCLKRKNWEESGGNQN
jgi:hypothetical protein